MSKTCPKCGYTRRPEDAAPEYECPKCGVVYSKIGQRAERAAKNPPTAPRGRRAIAFLVVAALAAWAAGHLITAQRSELQERARQEQELQRRMAAEKSKQELEKAVSALSGQYAKWKDAYHLAASTARIALSGPVGALQVIRRDTEALIVPACLDPAKAELTKGMGLVIEGFFAFMQDPKIGETLFEWKVAPAKAAFLKYETQADACPKPAP